MLEKLTVIVVHAGSNRRIIGCILAGVEILIGVRCRRIERCCVGCCLGFPLCTHLGFPLGAANILDGLSLFSIFTGTTAAEETM